MAATPVAAVRTAAVAPATTTTLTWKASYAKSPITGTAVLSGASTYATDKVVVKATGIKKGATVTLKIFEKAGSRYVTFAHVTLTATLNSSSQFVHTWSLTTAERGSLKYGVAHGYPIYFRLIDGTTTATGRLIKA
jgi:hypothetical protein